jgi:hypothetical protein
MSEPGERASLTSATTDNRRALATGNPTIATAAAAELPRLSLGDALKLVLLYRDSDLRRFELRRRPLARAPLPRASRPVAGRRRLALAALRGLGDGEPVPAAKALAMEIELGLERGPYDDERAEGHAREALLPTDWLFGAGGTTGRVPGDLLRRSARAGPRQACRTGLRRARRRRGLPARLNRTALETGAWYYDASANRWEHQPELLPPERERSGLV